MVEELKEASDIKKLIGKNKGDEDPLLVAQRFLNIFRQLHIFDQQRREEFNSMILALPPETRGTFGALPGGSLLQEYVDELEISRGLMRSSSSVPQPTLSTSAPSESKDSPLSRAKNAASATTTNVASVITGEAKIVADASFAQVLSQSVSSALMSVNASQSSNLEKILSSFKETGGTSQIVPDEKFANSMARAFSQALQFSDANKKADIQELIKAVRESRKIELPDGFPLAAAPVSENDTSLAKTIADTIAKAIKPNAAPAASSSNADMKELIKAIRDNKGVDVDALSKAMINGLKPLIDNMANAGQKTQQLKITTDNNFSEIITNAVAKTFEISEKKHQEQTEKLIAGFQDVMRKDKAEKLISDFQKVLQNNSSTDGNAVATTPVFASGAFSGSSEQFEKITQEFTKTLRSLSDSRKSENREIAQAIKETQKELIKLLKWQNDKEKQNNKSHASFEAPINEIINKVAQAQANIFQELARQQTNELSTIISLALKESQKSSVDTIVETFKKLQEQNIQVNLPIFRPMPNTSNANVGLNDEAELQQNKSGNRKSRKSYIQKSIEKAKLLEDEEEVERNIAVSTREIRQNVAEYIKSEFEPVPLDNDQNVSSTDWGFSDNEVDSDKSITDIASSDTKSSSDDIVKHEDDQQEENNLPEAQNVEGQDWEWEYEEEGTSEEEPQGLEGQDWEWEYEEEGASEEEPQGIEGQDWEWEYEEDTSGEENVDEIDGIEGQDWEWEYEEDPNEELPIAAAENEQLPIDESTEDNTSPLNQIELDKGTQTAESKENLNPTATENVGIDNATEEPKAKSATTKVMSSADLLASLKQTPNSKAVIKQTEIGIAELRNYENAPDPYLIGNIGV